MRREEVKILQTLYCCKEWQNRADVKTKIKQQKNLWKKQCQYGAAKPTYLSKRSFRKEEK